MKTILASGCLAWVFLTGTAPAAVPVDPAVLEKGAEIGVATKKPESKPLADGEPERVAHAFTTYMDQFFRWLRLTEGIHDWSAPNEAREKQMLPPKEMTDPKFYSASLLDFIRKHKTAESDMKADTADKLVMAWYLWTHPHSGSSQKYVAHTLLITVFGADYGARKDVETEIRQMEKDEYQTQSKLDGKR
ncbi:MAG: hypothetical protein EOP87_12845 [Verrucomicrobiaceae bacterium]|nr:MAG: hypothetical protein EOP87_12845 [Verrucomicrobiaceae bacterium]